MLGHLTYLIYETVWAVPVIALQWIVGKQNLWRQRKTLMLCVLVPTAYLVITDAYAIGHHIWTLHADRIVGIRLGNVPIEEAIFFGLTNMLIVQSVLLVAHFRRR